MTPQKNLSHPAPPDLCVADDASFWPWLSWPALAAIPGKDRKLVLLPVAGMADWGLGHPLDAEETLLMPLLRDGCRLSAADACPLVLPPLRFVFGADPGCAFAVDQPTAQAAVAEIAASVHAAGFRRLVIVNASPWNEEVCAAIARDLRLSLDLQVFVIHLSALGLDLHPTRGKERRRLQTVLTALYGREPEAAEELTPTEAGWGEEPVDQLPGPATPLEDAAAEGAAALAAAAARLAGLFSDISATRPLHTKFSP